MGNMRKILELTNYNLKKWATNPRIYVLLILLFCYTQYILTPLKNFAGQVGIHVAPYIFPFYISATYTGKLILMGAVLLFCDAPFTESDHPYLILRSGRKKWYLGQFLYIMIGAAVYSLVLILLSIVVLFPNVSTSSGWGKIISTLAQTGIAYMHGIPIAFNPVVILEFSPMQAMALQFLLCWLTCAMLGNLLFFINAKISRLAGVITAISLVLLQVAAELSGGATAAYFSPTSWISFNMLNLDGTSGYPSVLFTIFALLILNGVLAWLSYLSVRKKDVEILKPI